MGWFDFLFGKKHRIEDSFFGSMLHMTFKDASKNYYECSRPFLSIQSSIDLGVAADEKGPTQKQKYFYLNIEKEYEIICESITPLLEEVFQNWNEGFKILDFEKEFKPVYIFLPACEGEDVNWEIAFDTEHDENHQFTIEMKNLMAINVGIDG